MKNSGTGARACDEEPSPFFRGVIPNNGKSAACAAPQGQPGRQPRGTSKEKIKHRAAAGPEWSANARSDRKSSTNTDILGLLNVVLRVARFSGRIFHNRGRVIHNFCVFAEHSPRA
jgi:hypothetical protein